ncbi:MAG: YraN family protein [Cyclobacteriaceae bacterium]
MDRKTKGKQGEELAQTHYIELGYEILEKNYRYKRAEVDFIALFQEELLVFVEVKARDRRDYGEPETFVSAEQQTRIKEAAEDYIFGIDWHKDIRFDIVCVDPQNQMEVFQDAF